jgi:hypothetical protein
MKKIFKKKIISGLPTLIFSRYETGTKGYFFYVLGLIELELVFGIGLGLVKPLLCYVLSLQPNNLFPYAQGMQKFMDVDAISCGHPRKRKTDVGKM